MTTLPELRRQQADIAQGVDIKDGVNNTVVLSVREGDDEHSALNLNQLRLSACLKCYAIGHLCTGLMSEGENKGSAIVSLNERLESAPEQLVAIAKADLAPCGLLGTALLKLV